MSKFEIKVTRSKPPKRPDGLLKRLRHRIGGAIKPILLRPKIIVLPAIASFVLFVGTPHAGWEYQCRHATRGFGSCDAVAWCAYYGVQGRRVVHPEYGERCRLITLLPLDWKKLTKGNF